MSDKYTPEELKAFAEKDLRICKQNALRHATMLLTSGSVDPGELTPTQCVISMAREFVDFMYEVDTNQTITPGPVSLCDNPVVNEVAVRAGDKDGVLYDVNKVQQAILDAFGKLPTNMKSVDKILSTVNFEGCEA